MCAWVNCIVPLDLPSPLILIFSTLHLIETEEDEKAWDDRSKQNLSPFLLLMSQMSRKGKGQNQTGTWEWVLYSIQVVVQVLEVQLSSRLGRMCTLQRSHLLVGGGKRFSLVSLFSHLYFESTRVMRLDQTREWEREKNERRKIRSTVKELSFFLSFTLLSTLEVDLAGVGQKVRGKKKRKYVLIGLEDPSRVRLFFRSLSLSLLFLLPLFLHWMKGQVKCSLSEVNNDQDTCASSH